MLDLGFTADAVKAVPDPRAGREPARASRRGAGAAGSALLAAGAEAAIEYEPRGSDARARRRDPCLERAARRRRGQLPRPDCIPLRALALLPREVEDGRWLRAVSGGLSPHRAAALTEKDELRATCTPENPFGAHLCVRQSEIVRIYSTSGTTGTPSFIPLTAEDLDNWVTGSARSYAASGVSAGERIVSTYNAGPFAAGAALAAFDRIGLCHVPFGTGNSERLLSALQLLRPEAAVLTPSYAAHLVERATERGSDLSGSSVRRVLVAGEPGGGEPAFRALLEEGWGARVTEAMGIGDIGVSLWGECEEQDGMHLGARGFVHAELIDPETGALSRWRTGRAASSC